MESEKGKKDGLDIFFIVVQGIAAKQRFVSIIAVRPEIENAIHGGVAEPG